ncbi:hypothetical protein [Photobacterium leiognathi]|uniref:hypothetical protein n=1 Tax=Photobacterium leiognathi TaxID=553611 RepID=UPI0027382C56|nr:hypothetical protein [Photobacterium leiognathi]
MITSNFEISNKNLIKKCIEDKESGFCFDKRDLLFSVVNSVIDSSLSHSGEAIDISVVSGCSLLIQNPEIENFLNPFCDGMKIRNDQVCMIVIRSTAYKQAIVSSLELTQNLMNSINHSFSCCIEENKREMLQ